MNYTEHSHENITLLIITLNYSGWGPIHQGGLSAYLITYKTQGLTHLERTKKKNFKFESKFKISRTESKHHLARRCLQVCLVLINSVIRTLNSHWLSTTHGAIDNS